MKMQRNRKEEEERKWAIAAFEFSKMLKGKLESVEKM